MSSFGSSYAPACDQCRLKKIRCGREHPICLNCRRTRVTCGFSERGKKSSQSNIIINSLEEMKSRLHHIDQAVSKLKAAPQSDQTPSPEPDQLVSWAIMNFDHRVDETSISSCDGRSSRARHKLMNGQHHGSSSLASLLCDIYLALESNTLEDSSEMDESMDKNTRDCLTMMENLSNSLLSDESLDLSGESLPPKLPPKRLLDATLESYFRQVNPTLPVFDKHSFYENVYKNYEAGSDQANRAWIMCFNSVILQTVSTRTASSFAERSPDDESSPLRANKEAEILTPFLVNLRRAVGRLDWFLQPSLVSVQALISMENDVLIRPAPLMFLCQQCLVSQDNFQYRLASLLLQQACFVAKSIGLHQQNALSGDYTSAEKSQRVCVFWALYVIDKTITSMIGQSCYMPMFDCNVGLPEEADLAHPTLKHLIARIELASIQEDTYKKLHSSQPIQSGSERKSSISHLSKKLTHWALKHCDLFEENDEKCGPISVSSPPSTATINLQANTALTYHFHVIRIMVHRPSKDPSDRKQYREDAVACVRLLQRLSGDSASETGSIMLRQTIRDHPLISFFVLFHHVVESPQSEESAHDLRLMNLTTDILQRVPGFARSRAYNTHLSSCCRAAATFIHKPAILDSIAPTVPLRLNTYNSDNQFAAFNSFVIDNKRKNTTSNDNKKNGEIDHVDNHFDNNSDSNSISNTLARSQHWPASLPPTEYLSPTHLRPASFAAPNWTMNLDYASLADMSNLSNAIYRTDVELPQQWPPASSTPLEQHHANPPQPQQQQNSGGGWSQEMDMGFLMAEDSMGRWGQGWLTKA